MADSPSYHTARKSPAFQFYPDSFDQGTADMTLAEVGGYMRLLMSQWAKGSIPGDNIIRLAGIMRCTPATAKKVWMVVKEKFVRHEDGWRNARLEEERTKQEDYRALQASRGRESARRREANRGSTEPPTAVQPSPQPEVNPRIYQPEGNSPSPSPIKNIPKEVPPPPNSTSSGAPSEALVVGPIKFLKKGEKYAFYGSRLHVPHVFHDELKNKLGGENPHEKLVGFYETINADIEENQTPVLDVFDFLRPKFLEWARELVIDAELEKFRPKGA